MAQYMLLCYQEEVDLAEQDKREAGLPLVLDLYRGLRESGVMVGMGRLQSVESATSVRVRSGEAEIIDGPFAITKERLAGYYVMECADLDEALKLATRMPGAEYGTIEVRPMLSAGEWVARARDAAADVPEEAVRYLT